MEAPYKDLYTWDQTDSTQNNVEYRPVPEGPGDVWHELTFTNTSGQPFTTAVATTMRDGEVIGQDMMHYVSPKGKAELRITKALDIRAEAAEEEVSRQREAVKRAPGIAPFDLVTLKGTLAITNSKPQEVKLRIRKDRQPANWCHRTTIPSRRTAYRQRTDSGQSNWPPRLEPDAQSRRKAKDHLHLQTVRESELVFSPE